MQLDFYGELARLCKDSYFDFVKTFWKILCPTDPLVCNWHIPYLCNELQVASDRVLAGEPKEYDLVVNISPGTSKSTIFSIMFQPWLWARDPSIRFLGVSCNDDLAWDFSSKAKRIVESPLYQKLFPHVCLRQDVNSKSLWANTLNGERMSYGIGSNVVGKHAHIIVMDDLINAKQARSPADLLSAEHFVREIIPTRKTDKARTFSCLVMQRLSVNDPTAVILKDWPNVKMICLPGEETDDITPPELRKNYVDGLFDPVRMPRPVLEDMRSQLHAYGYAGQILQVPIPASGGAIKVDRIVQHELGVPQNIKFVKKVRAWDKAALDKAGDFTTGILLGLTEDNQVWILSIIRGQWSTDEREGIILATAHADGKSTKITFEQEGGSGGLDSVRQSVKRLGGFIVHVEKHVQKGGKLARAEAFATQVNFGNVHTALRGKIWDDFTREAMHFPDVIHDDQVDAVALAYTVLTRQTIRLGVIK